MAEKRSSALCRRGRASRGRVPFRLGAAVGAAAAVLAVAGCGSSSSSHSSHTQRAGATPDSSAMKASPNGSLGPEGMPLERGPTLASPSSTAPGIPVDGVRCAPVEQLAYHIHARLQVYVDGQPRSLPGAIGLLGPVADPTAYGPFYVASRCYYWLHTHTSDGVIHIESPTAKIYTLGDFFDEWGQPLSSDRVAGAGGKVTAFINGKPWSKSPRALPLLAHGVIQLDVGSPVIAFSPISWADARL